MLMKERRFTKEEVELLLNKLSDDDQRLFELYFIDKLELTEISKLMLQHNQKLLRRIKKINYLIKKHLEDVGYLKAIDILYSGKF